MAGKVIFKRGEAKHLTLSVSQDGSAVDLSGATLFLGVKKSKTDSGFVLSKTDGEFNKSQAGDGVVSVFLSESDLDQEAGLYVAELKVEFPDGTIDKSLDLALVIEPAVT
ncbi:MAG: BppU family phage baseplate upper protein [Deltaproteobacteria bacterium]|nr:BppU family phage baseplate upper protein [Deltaproteobacteria bacterium]